MAIQSQLININMTSNTEPKPFIASASSEYDYQSTRCPTWKMFSETTKPGITLGRYDCWLNGINSEKTSWLMIELDRLYTLTKLVFRERNYSGPEGRIPSSIKIYVGNDKDNLTFAQELDTSKWSHYGGLHHYELDIPVIAKVIKFEMDARDSDNHVAIGHCDLYGIPIISLLKIDHNTYLSIKPEYYNSVTGNFNVITIDKLTPEIFDKYGFSVSNISNRPMIINGESINVIEKIHQITLSYKIISK